MRTTIKFAALALVATAGTAFAQDATMQQDLNVGSLSPTCSLSNPVAGSLTYSEAANEFLAASNPATIDAYIRNMSAIVLDPDSAISDGTAINSVTWGNGNSTVGSYNFQDDWITATPYTHAARAATSNTDEFSSTLTLNPQTVAMDGAFNPMQNTTYSLNYSVICIQ